MKIMFNERDVSASLFSYKRTCQLADGKLIGQAVSQLLEIELDNEVLKLSHNDCNNAVITVIPNSGDDPIQFKIASYPEKWDGTIKFTCYDTIGFLNSPYKSELEYSETSTTTISVQLDEIAALSNITIDRSIIPDTVKNKVVAWIDTSITYRAYLGLIAELMGCNVVQSGSFGSVQFRPFKYDLDKITFQDCLNYEKTNSINVSKVVYDDGVHKIESGDDTGSTLYLDTGNLYVSDQADVDRVLTAVKDLKFVGCNGFEVDTIHNVHIGQRVELVNVFVTVITGFTEDFKGGDVCDYTLVSNVNTEAKESTVEKVDTRTKIRKVQTTVNQIKGRIEIIAQDTEETKSTTSSLQVAMEGINNTVEQVNRVLTNNGLKEDTNISNLKLLVDRITGSVSSLKNSLIGTINRLKEINNLTCVQKPDETSIFETTDNHLRLGYATSGAFEFYTSDNFTDQYDDSKIHSLSVTLKTEDEGEGKHTVTLQAGNRTLEVHATNQEQNFSINDISFVDTKSISVTAESGFYLDISKMRLIEGDVYVDVAEGIQSLKTTVEQNDGTLKFISNKLDTVERGLKDEKDSTRALKKYVIVNDENTQDASITLCTSVNDNGTPNGFCSKWTSRGLWFYQNYGDSDPIASLENGNLYIYRAVVVKSMRVGRHVWTAAEDDEGNDLLILQWVGGE